MAMTDDTIHDPKRTNEALVTMVKTTKKLYGGGRMAAKQVATGEEEMGKLQETAGQ